MIDDPLYISEEVFETMVHGFSAEWLIKNPNFASFDLLDSDDDTLRQNDLVIRIFAKMHNETNYHLLIEYDIALCCLQFIGRDVRSLYARLTVDWTISSPVSNKLNCVTTHGWILHCFQ